MNQISLTDVLTALGDPIRLAIVELVFRHKGEVPWGDLEFNVNKATLSHHMKKLRLAGLIEHRKEGTRCFISLRRDLEKTYPGLLSAILKSKRTCPYALVAKRTQD
ncbi:MAG: helix-turn-helix transcriptional regulator [Bdellovibrionaceae bacterium]|nr:helix-turn-helix transcriptional regulator [Pseudobdellovibrionaceae bacterium]